MGSGVSSERNTQSRLRNALVLRAYNVRSKDITLEEQFAEYAFRKEQGGVLYISIDNIKKVLSVDAPWIDDLFHTLIGSNVENDDEKHIQYDHFVEFLETGNYVGNAFTKVNKTSNISSSSSINSETDNRSNESKRYLKSKGHGMRGKVALKKPPPPIATNFAMHTPTTAGHNNTGPPSPPMGSHNNSWSQEQGFEQEPPVKSSNQSHSGSAEKDREGRRGPGSVSSSLHPEDSLSVDDKSIGSSKDNKDNKESTLFKNIKFDDKSFQSSAVVPSKGLEVGDSSSFAIQDSGIKRNMFRKSEVLKQERIIRYTTVDANGQTQELTETETTQTEVLHMECRDTGQFARRETTQFEHVEKFNEEVVNEESGKEEYVHLKSKDDEYEFTDSTMPNRAAAGEQPQSPRVNDESKRDRDPDGTQEGYPEGYEGYKSTGDAGVPSSQNHDNGEGYTLSDDAAAYCAAYAEQQAERLCAQAGEALGSRFWQEAYKQAVELATEAILESEVKNNNDINMSGNVTGEGPAGSHMNNGEGNSHDNQEMYQNPGDVPIHVDVDSDSHAINSTGHQSHSQGMPSATASTHPEEETPVMSPLSPTPQAHGFDDHNREYGAGVINQADDAHCTRYNAVNDEKLNDTTNDGPVFMDIDDIRAVRARAHSSSRFYDLDDDADVDVDQRAGVGGTHNETRSDSYHSNEFNIKDVTEMEDGDGVDDDVSMRGSISPGSLRDIHDFGLNITNNITDAPPNNVILSNNEDDIKEFSDID